VSTDALPETQGALKSPRAERRGARRRSAPAQWWWRGLLATGALAAVASVGAMIQGALSSRQTGPRLAHMVTRGDLIVTVTAQGTLESSENEEIKCKVRTARVPILWVIENGTEVEPGDELVRLETVEYEERFNEVSKGVHSTKSAVERSQADVARAELAVSEYLEGRYRSQLMTLEKDLAIAESRLRTAQSMRAHTEMMAERGYVSDLDVEERAFAVRQAELNVEVTKTEINVLEEFNKAMALETLKGNLKAAKARHEANKERLKQITEQLELCKGDLEHCVVKAERSGVVVYPTAEPWKHVPEIEEGAGVYMGQTMLLMPDLSQMQVKVGIPESAIDRVKPGLPARVTLPDRMLEGEVSTVASVAAPAGWQSANVALYDTTIKLPSVKGLMPGMSAEVEIIAQRHEDVLTIPVAAVVETAEGDFCWVRSAKGAERRPLRLGDSNDEFTVVKAGLKEGDEVMLNPLGFMSETEREALEKLDEAEPDERDSTKSAGKGKPQDASSGKLAGDPKQNDGKADAAERDAPAKRPKNSKPK
jgi:multidrug efflux pump subunit AcrA (membrane-fusion protein)